MCAGSRNCIWSFRLSAGAVTFASVLVTAFALTTQVAPEPCCHPRYAPLLLGMVLGNTLASVELAMDT
jgi:ABC-type iron transport system FetAB permease component